MIELQIPEKLQPLVAKKKRFKIIIGGRGSAKSVSVAKIIGAKASHGSRVLAAREFQNSINESVHAVISGEIKAHEMPGFNIQATTISHKSGGSVFYRGLARNIESIKSLNAIDLAWVEEAQSLSKESIEKLTPTIREPGSEIWMTANPGSSKDPFSQRFIKPFEKELHKNGGYYEDDMHIIIFINYMDNPWFPPELEQERLYDKEHKSAAEYNHIWLGAYNDTIDNAIIMPDWFDACIDAHVKLGFKPSGVEVVSHDPSDLGPDTKGLAYRHGVVVLDVLEEEFGDINEGGDWAADYAEAKKPDVFIWDGDGMGVGLRRQFNERLGPKSIALEMFNASAGVDDPDKIYEPGNDHGKKKTNRETFLNKRAQTYWNLRDRCFRTYRAVKHKEYAEPNQLISFSSEIEAMDLLRSEMCRIPQKLNNIGKFQVMSKKEMRALGIDSPNMSDSVNIGFGNSPPKLTARPRRVVRRPRKRGIGY